MGQKGEKARRGNGRVPGVVEEKVRKNKDGDHQRLPPAIV